MNMTTVLVICLALSSKMRVGLSCSKSLRYRKKSMVAALRERQQRLNAPRPPTLTCRSKPLLSHPGVMETL